MQQGINSPNIQGTHIPQHKKTKENKPKTKITQLKKKGQRA